MTVRAARMIIDGCESNQEVMNGHGRPWKVAEYLFDVGHCSKENRLSTCFHVRLYDGSIRVTAEASGYIEAVAEVAVGLNALRVRPDGRYDFTSSHDNFRLV